MDVFVSLEREINISQTEGRTSMKRLESAAFKMAAKANQSLADTNMATNQTVLQKLSINLAWQKLRVVPYTH